MLLNIGWSSAALNVFRRYFKNYVMVDLSDYPEIGISFKINLFLLAIFIAFICVMLYTNHVRSSMHLLVKQLMRHGSVSEDSAKTLKELGLIDNRTVRSVILRDGQLSGVVGQVGKKEYTYEEYVALEKSGNLPKNNIDFSSARFFLKESGTDRARRIFNFYDSSLVRNFLFTVLVLIIYVGVSLIVPSVLDAINGYIASL